MRNFRIFICAALLAGIFIAALPAGALAQTETQTVDPNREIPVIKATNCGVFSFSGCVMTLVGWVIYIILGVASRLFVIAGQLMDQAIVFSVDPKMYRMDVIYGGWVTVRDTVNLLFIFILLVIAIATILRLENYGAKRLLARLIVAALFVNFSFLATQYVIYASNLVTALFMPTPAQGQKTLSFSEKFVAGVNPNVLFKSVNQSDRASLEEVNKKLGRLQELYWRGSSEGGLDRFTPAERKEFDDLKAQKEYFLAQQEKLKASAEVLLLPVIISMIGVIIFLGFAGFALFTVAIMMLVRVVLLWFLLMTSPLAFLFSILPALQPYAKQWTGVLIKQAVWPIVFFFFFSIIIRIISSRFSDTVLGVNAAASTSFTSNYPLIMYYILLVMMLLFSLKIAKSASGVAAGTADSLIKRARGYTTGYVGKPAWSLTRRYPLEFARRGALAVGGGIAKRVQKPESLIGRALRAPVVHQTVGKLAQQQASNVLAARRQTVTALEEQIKDLNARELKDRYAAAIDPAMRAAILNQLAQKKDLKPDEARGFTVVDIEEGRRYLDAFGLKTGDVDALALQYMSIDELRSEKNRERALNVISGLNQKSLKQMAAEGGPMADKIAELFTGILGSTMEEIINNLKTLKKPKTDLPLNIGLGRWFEADKGGGGGARPILQSLGFPLKGRQQETPATDEEEEEGEETPKT